MRTAILFLLAVAANPQQVGQNAPASSAAATFQSSTQLVVETVSVKDKNGKAIVIDQLWGIDFGDGLKGGKNGGTNEMFFTAGPSNNLAGTFGVIVPD